MDARTFFNFKRLGLLPAWSFGKKLPCFLRNDPSQVRVAVLKKLLKLSYTSLVLGLFIALSDSVEK